MAQQLTKTDYIKAELCRKSFAYFVKQAWHIVESSPLVWGWHLDAVCEHLQAVAEGRIRHLIINIPPRHSKSLISSVLFPIWIWLTRPQDRFLLLSYALKLSVRDNVKARDLIRTEWFQDRWGHIVELKGDQDQKERYETKAGGFRQTTSIGSSATGEGGEFVICDDANGADESDDVRKAALEWWDATMPTRLNDLKTGSFIIIQQRTAENDLTGHLLEKGGYTLLKLPMEYEGDTSATPLGFVDPRQIDGELLSPERFGPEEVDFLKRELGAFKAAGQLQQRPTARDGGLLNGSWFKFWYPNTIPQKFDDTCISVDCAFKGEQDSDYVVMQAWGRVKAEYYLLDQYRAQLDFVKTLAAFQAFCVKWSDIKTKLIEDKANGPAVISALRKSISGIIPINPGKDSKESRVSAISPIIESGNVYIPHRATWKEQFLHEMATFPKGKHDDMVDCLSMALMRLDKQSSQGIRYIQHSLF